jgi:ATP synthase protein I
MRSRAREQSGAPRTSLAARVLLAQLGLSAALAAIFWGVGGFTSGYSALLGGLTCVIPNAFLALRLAAPRRDPGAGALVRAAYIGELGKLALTVLMFVIVFTQVKPLAAGPLFLGFVATQLTTLAGLRMREGRRPNDDRTRSGAGVMDMSSENGD